MGAYTGYAIASWQAKSGIKPATGGTADILQRMSDAAFELIKVIELEKSGIRDGDGFWHGSDGFGGTAEKLASLIERYLKPSPAPADDLPF
jgi:hypothetical protein